MNNKQLANFFSKNFILTYFLFCTITSVIIGFLFFVLKLTAIQHRELIHTLLHYLITYYLVLFFISITSFVYFRFSTPKWMVHHTSKKFYFDMFWFITSILSYIPMSILIFSVVTLKFGNDSLIASILLSCLQIPNILGGVLASVGTGDYSLALVIVLFFGARVSSPLLLLFSYQKRNKDSLDTTIHAIFESSKDD